MTRRLTVGSRSEMGLPYVPEPDTPVTTPWPHSHEKDYWRVPSRWQTSPPRFRQVLKIIGLVFLTSFILKIYYDKDLPVLAKEKHLEDKEKGKDPSQPDGNWPWKDFPL